MHLMVSSNILGLKRQGNGRGGVRPPLLCLNRTFKELVEEGRNLNEKWSGAKAEEHVQVKGNGNFSGKEFCLLLHG